MFEVVDTGIAAPTYSISGTVRKGPWIMSAQIPKDPVTGILVDGDIEVQARRLFENMRMAMQAAGGSLQDVMQTLVYLIDKNDSAGMNKIYSEFFPTAPYPNRATFVVKELMRPGMRIEVVATAYID